MFVHLTDGFIVNLDHVVLIGPNTSPGETAKPHRIFLSSGITCTCSDKDRKMIESILAIHRGP